MLPRLLTQIGKKITADPAFHELVTQAAKQLGIKEHTVIDAEGNKVKLSAPVEAKVCTP